MHLSHHRTGTGEPLVLIHGIGSRWQVWEPVMARLAASREVIALDLPGFGASPMPPAGTPAGPDSLTSLVAGFLEEIGVSHPHIAGNSLGGLIALELAKRDLVRSATALSPAGFANRSETMITRALFRVSIGAARWSAPQIERLVRFRAARLALTGAFFAHPMRVPMADTVETVRAFAAAPGFDATLPTIKAREFQGGGAIEVPVTIAWAEHDRVLPPRQARRAARSIPGARSVTLYGCGHVPTYDDPEQVAQVLLEGSASS